LVVILAHAVDNDSDGSPNGHAESHGDIYAAPESLGMPSRNITKAATESQKSATKVHPIPPFVMLTCIHFSLKQ
jgi:hypothetical protein